MITESLSLNFDAPPEPGRRRSRQTPTRTEKVAGLFMRCRGEWIDSEVIAGIGGRCGWRTRVSECRTDLGMDIRNRQRRIAKTDGDSYIVSEYGYKVGDASA